MKQKYSQKQICFLYLMQEAPRKIEVYDFIGEKTIFGKPYFLSYKGTTRMSEMFRDLQDKGLHRELFTGQSGAKYYRYWFKQNELSIKISGYYLDPLRVEAFGL